MSECVVMKLLCVCAFTCTSPQCMWVCTSRVCVCVCVEHSFLYVFKGVHSASHVHTIRYDSIIYSINTSTAYCYSSGATQSSKSSLSLINQECS